MVGSSVGWVRVAACTIAAAGMAVAVAVAVAVVGGSSSAGGRIVMMGSAVDSDGSTGGWTSFSTVIRSSIFWTFYIFENRAFSRSTVTRPRASEPMSALFTGSPD